jgi:hypothetical protein
LQELGLRHVLLRFRYRPPANACKH